MSTEHILELSRDGLISVSEQLTEYLAESEAVFLLAGERLQVVEKRARDLVTASSASMAATSGDVAGGADRVSAGLADLKRCLADSRAVLEEGAKGLVHVLAGIDGLGQFRGEFRRAGVSLWSLAISMRVENARAPGDRSGFETVVADVRRLGAQIEIKFDAMMAQSRSLRESAAHALVRAETFLAREADKLVGHVDATVESVAEMHKMRASAASIGGGAAAATEQIAGEVMAILTSLQMHDIARQMMEHVREELDGLGREADLAEVAALANLQASQLANARQTLTGALDEIAKRLERISSVALGLSQQTRQMAEISDGHNIFSRIDAGIEASSAALRDQLSRERFTTSAMCRVSGAMNDLSRFAREIDRIGAEVKLIALNAQVQAEKSGEEGRSMAVLARAIRELSVEVDNQTASVGKIMTRISNEASKLGSDQATEASNAATTEGAVANMSALLAELHAEYAGLSASIATTARDGAALRADVEALAQTLRQHTARAEALRELEDELREVSAVAAKACGAATVAAAERRLRAAASRYTMEHERAVHQAVTTNRSAPPPSTVKPNVARSEGPTLGDNVELF